MKEEIENLFEEILEKYKDTEYYANIDYYGSEEELTKAMFTEEEKRKRKGKIERLKKYGSEEERNNREGVPFRFLKKILIFSVFFSPRRQGTGPSEAGICRRA